MYCYIKLLARLSRFSNRGPQCPTHSISSHIAATIPLTSQWTEWFLFRTITLVNHALIRLCSCHSASGKLVFWGVQLSRIARHMRRRETSRRGVIFSKWWRISLWPNHSLGGHPPVSGVVPLCAQCGPSMRLCAFTDKSLLKKCPLAMAAKRNRKRNI